MIFIYLHLIYYIKLIKSKYFYIMKVIYINTFEELVHQSKRCTTNFKYVEM